VATEGVGFSGPKDKQDTDGQPYLIHVRVYMKYNFILDEMNNPQKGISGDTGKTV
jgi:hypothetical protein